MELSINDEKIRGILKEILIEMIQEKRELFYEIIVEAIEEVALANAITEGRKDEFVSEDRILGMLEG